MNTNAHWHDNFSTSPQFSLSFPDISSTPPFFPMTPQLLFFSPTTSPQAFLSIWRSYKALTQVTRTTKSREWWSIKEKENAKTRVARTLHMANCEESSSSSSSKPSYNKEGEKLKRHSRIERGRPKMSSNMRWHNRRKRRSQKDFKERESRRWRKEDTKGRS